VKRNAIINKTVKKKKKRHEGQEKGSKGSQCRLDDFKIVITDYCNILLIKIV